MYDLEWPLSKIKVFVADIRGITILTAKLQLDLSAAMTTVTKSIKRNKQLSAHSISMEIYNSIVGFPCDNTHSLADLQVAVQYNNYLQFRFLDCLVRTYSQYRRAQNIFTARSYA